MSIDRDALVSAARLLKVEGSKSGPVPGDLRLSDDERTILFKPTHAFQCGERVTIELEEGLRGRDGQSTGRFSSRFTISSHELSPEQKVSVVRDILEGEVTFDTLSTKMVHDSRAKISSAADALPEDFPPIAFTVDGSTEQGGIFLSTFSADPRLKFSPYLMILDNSAAPFYYQRMLGPSFDFKVSAGGLMTYFDGGARYYYELDNSNAIVDSFACGNGYTTDFHDLEILPNGHALVISYDPKQIDMSAIVDGGDTAAIVTGLVIQEIDQNKYVVFEWRSWDHFQITDATHEDLTAHRIDYVHGNAVELDHDGNILLSSRHLDEITKINRQSGKIMWRWGGKHNEFAFVNDDLRFSHQHDIRRLSDGTLTIFDNGNYRSPQYSLAVEYRLDEQAKTCTLTWQYRNTPDLYAYAMGNVQRLPNGNRFIGWGTAGMVTEVQPDGEKVCQIELPEGVYTYRAFRFRWRSDVTITQPGFPSEYTLFQNYPNPFNPNTIIKYQLPEKSVVRLTIYNSIGQIVRTLVDGVVQNAGSKSILFHAIDEPSAVYFYRLEAMGTVNPENSFTNVRKMILLK